MAYARPTGPKTKLINGKSVTNLASYNFLNFANLERLRNKAVEVLHDYGVGACGPPGFYGTLGLTSFWLALIADVHTQVEVDLARFLGVEAAIIYAQAFSTISSVIPDFSKRGDIIVAYRLNLRQLTIETKELILRSKRVYRYPDRLCDGLNITIWTILSASWKKYVKNIRDPGSP